MTKTHQADVVLVFMTLLAASGWLFTKVGIDGIPPMAFLGLRFAGASLLLLPFCLKKLLMLSRSQWQNSILIGLAQASGMLIWGQALSQSEQISEGAFITSTLVILVPFVGHFLFRSRISAETLWALPVAVAGLALLALKGGWNFERSQLLFLTSALCFACQINLISHKGQDIPALTMTFIPLATVGIAGLFVSGMTESWPQEVDNKFWVLLVGSILVATSFRYFLQTWGFKHSNPAVAAIILLLEPVWTAIMSVAWLGDTFDAQKMAGCALILLSLLITRSSQIRKLFRQERVVVVES